MLTRGGQTMSYIKHHMVSEDFKALMVAAAVKQHACREATTRRLIGILRDTTQSRAIHAECVQILEWQP